MRRDSTDRQIDLFLSEGFQNVVNGRLLQFQIDIHGLRIGRASAFCQKGLKFRTEEGRHHTIRRADAQLFPSLAEGSRGMEVEHIAGILVGLLAFFGDFHAGEVDEAMIPAFVTLQAFQRGLAVRRGIVDFLEEGVRGAMRARSHRLHDGAKTLELTQGGDERFSAFLAGGGPFFRLIAVL